MKFRIKSPSRLHFSLLDLNGHLGRVDGGIGMGLEEPNTVIEFSDETNPGVIIKASKIQTQEIQRMIQLIGSNYEVDFSNLTINVLETIPAHVGLGAKTQFLLTIAKGLTHLKGIVLSVAKLTALVHRGGTSGIGYQVFEHGGFVTDLGHSFGTGNEKEDFQPSSASSAPPALPFYRTDISDTWNVILICLNVPQGANQDREVNVFRSKCPVRLRDVEQISHRLLFQVIPAFLTSDLALLGQGLNFINTHGFKKEEILLQGHFLQKLIVDLWEKFQLPLGMSSFGPTLFLICEKGEHTQHICNFLQNLIDKSPNSPGGKVLTVKPTNTGYEIIPIE